jgi:hypothetical protein
MAFVSAVFLSTITACLAETPEERQACTDDAFRVCNDAIPDQDRVFHCLVQKKEQISALCRTALAPYLPVEQPTARATPKQANRTKSKSSSKNGTRRGKGPLSLNPNAE